MKPLLMLPLLFFVACSDDNSPQTELDAGVDFASPDIGQDADVDQETDGGTDQGETLPDSPQTLDHLFRIGPQKVGYLEFSYSYDAPGQEEPREIPVKVWYPADPATDADPARYAVGGIVNVPTEVALREPAPSTDGPFPTVIYSHGSGGEGLLAYPYGEHLASWGWVVFAPNHVGNTALDGVQMSFAPFLATTLHRVTDIRALLDTLEAGFESPVSGIADLNNVVLFGHSFGGYTTLALGGADLDTDLLVETCAGYGEDSCEFINQEEVQAAFRAGLGDSRIDAIVPQAPALIPLFAEGEIDSIELPVMLQSGRMDKTLPDEVHAIPAWEALDGPDDIWVEMPLGGHFSFISICTDLSEDILTLFRPDAPDDGCSEDFIDSQLAVSTLTAYLHAFARLHVLQEVQWASLIEGDAFSEGFEITLKE